MVSLHIRYELQLAGVSFLTGVWLMMAYDCLRVLRLLIPHSYAAVGLEDAAYWIYAGLMTFSMLYSENDGMLRAYAIAGVLLGMALYDRLASRFYLKALKKILESITIKLRRHRDGRDGGSSYGREKAKDPKRKEE